MSRRRRARVPRRLPFFCLLVALILGISGAHAQPTPQTVGAGVDGDWIFLNGWTPGSTISLDIGGFQMNFAVDANGQGNIQRQTHGQDIVPGMEITASDGTVTKSLTVADIRITSVDVGEDTVSGIAPPNANVHVNVNQGPGPPLGEADTTADASGNWSVDFTSQVDLKNDNMGISASVGDEDGDFTNADRFLPAPIVGASVEFDGLFLNGWTPNSTVQVTVGDASPIDVPIDGSGQGNLQRQQHGQDIVPGTRITATDGQTPKELIVVDLRITDVNRDTDVVTGIAPAGATVHVFVNQMSPSPPVGQAQTTADGSGNWSVDFTSQVDIVLGMNVGANVSDADGDVTNANKSLFLPTIGANIRFDNVFLNSWTPNSTVSVTVGGGAPIEVPIDGNGQGNLQRQAHGQDIAAGTGITATDGTTTKELTVANLRIVDVNRADDVVSGIAPAGATVFVNLNRAQPGPSPPLGQAQVTADSSGNWSVDFTSQVDIDFTVNVNASVNDDDFDSTNDFVGPPTIGANLDFDGVFLNNWTPNSTVSVTVGSAAPIDVPIDGNGNGNLQRQAHGQDIVAGMRITATAGSAAKELIVANLQITDVDRAEDVVSGIAPAGATVFVNVHRAQPGPSPPLGQAQVTADPSGNWSVDFTSQVDIDFTVNVNAHVNDDDLDSTNDDQAPPTVSAHIDFDNVGLNGWPANSSVHVVVDGQAVDVQVDANGNGNVSSQMHGKDVVAGMTITATHASTTKTLQVADLRITSIDVNTETVAGTGPATTPVDVSVFQPFASVSVTSDGSGNWSAQLPVDIQAGMSAGATVRDGEGDATNTQRAATLPKPPGAIAIGFNAPDSIDPLVSFAGWEVIDQMFRGLTRYDRRTGQLTLDLATTQRASRDLRTWTFDLRAANWSDGTAITAQDVVFGIERAKATAVPDLRRLLDPIASVRAVDADTVQLRLVRPIAYLTALLSVPTARPMPEHAIAQHGAAWLQPGNIVVSGAYTLTHHSAAGLVLEKNPQYGGPTQIETVIYDTTDQAAFRERYLQGELDFLSAGLLGLGPPAAVKDDPRFAADLVIGMAPGTQILVFNAAHGATTNVDVRRALSSATNRAKIAMGVVGDASFAAKTFTPPGVFGAVAPTATVGIGYDEAAARQYKAAAGSAFPSEITIRTAGPPSNPANNPGRAKAAGIIKEDWERIFGPGFTVTIEPVAVDDLIDQFENPDASAQAPVSMIGWLADYPDANNFLADGVRSLQTRWTHTAYNALVARGEATANPATRLNIYANAEGILTNREAAIAPMHTIADAFVHQPHLTVVGDRIENWSLTP